MRCCPVSSSGRWGRLSVFPGTFAYPAAAAAAVCAPLAEERVVLVDLLQGLVDKSFVILSASSALPLGPTRFASPQIDDTIRVDVG
jgi:hypothetical protein